MSNTKVFVGSGKIVQTKFGALTKLSFSKKDLETMQSNLSEQGWINVVLKEKQNKVDGKPTHYLEIDNWKPTNAPETTQQAEQVYGNNNRDLPF